MGRLSEYDAQEREAMFPVADRLEEHRGTVHREILRSIQRFEWATGMFVQSVEVLSDSSVGGGMPTTSVELEVELADADLTRAARDWLAERLGLARSITLTADRAAIPEELMVRIEGLIESGSASEVLERVEAAPSAPVSVLVHSRGGSIFDAFAIASILRARSRRTPVSLLVYGVAYGAAALLLAAVERVEIVEDGFVGLCSSSMVSTDPGGDSVSFPVSVDEAVEACYMERWTGTREALRDAMRSCSWFDARQALSLGLVDSVREAKG